MAQQRQSIFQRVLALPSFLACVWQYWFSESLKSQLSLFLLMVAGAWWFGGESVVLQAEPWVSIGQSVLWQQLLFIIGIVFIVLSAGSKHKFWLVFAGSWGLWGAMLLWLELGVWGALIMGEVAWLLCCLGLMSQDNGMSRCYNKMIWSWQLWMSTLLWCTALAWWYTGTGEAVGYSGLFATLMFLTTLAKAGLTLMPGWLLAGAWAQQRFASYMLLIVTLCISGYAALELRAQLGIKIDGLRLVMWLLAGALLWVGMVQAVFARFQIAWLVMQIAFLVSAQELAWSWQVFGALGVCALHGSVAMLWKPGLMQGLMWSDFVGTSLAQYRRRFWLGLWGLWLGSGIWASVLFAWLSLDWWLVFSSYGLMLGGFVAHGAQARAHVDVSGLS